MKFYQRVETSNSLGQLCDLDFATDGAADDG